jgi:ParB/RepB/Spo0J family partition protein
MIQPVPFVGQPATIPLVSIETHAQIRMRNGFDEESLTELASTIREHGVVQPIVVRRSPTDESKFIAIAGERRLLAASMAGLQEIPALIRDVTENEATILQAIENLQRENLCLADTAEAVARLVHHHKGVRPVAKLLGKSPSWVSKHAAVAGIGRDVRHLLDDGITNDPEILLGMQKLRSKAVNVYERLANGLAEGTVARADVRAAVDRLGESAVEAGAETASVRPTKASVTLDEAEWKAVCDVLASYGAGPLAEKIVGLLPHTWGGK